MLIVTGTGRSGTGTLAKLFGGFHEYRVAYLLDKYFAVSDPHSNPLHSLETRISGARDLHQGIDPERFTDSCNLYIHFLDAVYYLHPRARFILAVRNGKDFVRSGITRKWHEQRSFGTVPLLDDPYLDRWSAMTPLQRNAWLWTWRNTVALERLKVIPMHQKLIVRIEDLSDEAVISRIEEFSGLQGLDRACAAKRHNANPGYAFPPKEEWPASMHQEFDEIAGAVMVFLGYSE